MFTRFTKGDFDILKTRAFENPKGIISENHGSWDGMGERIKTNILEDIMQSLCLLNDTPRYLMLSPQNYYNFLKNLHDFDELYSIGAIFGLPPHDRSWLIVSDKMDEQYALITTGETLPELAAIERGEVPSGVTAINTY